VFTVNPITNNYARILCRIQYIFYRASFLIVICIHRGINTTRSHWSTKQQTNSHRSHWNNSHCCATGTTATSVDRTTATGDTGTPLLGSIDSTGGTTATGVDRTTATARATGTTAATTGVDQTTATRATGTTLLESIDSTGRATGPTATKAQEQQPPVDPTTSTGATGTTATAGVNRTTGATGVTRNDSHGSWSHDSHCLEPPERQPLELIATGVNWTIAIGAANDRQPSESIER